MTRAGTIAIAASLVLAPASARADGPMPASAEDFRLVMTSFTFKDEPVARDDFVSRRGRVYRFTDGSKEVVIINPKLARVELLDLGRRVQAAVAFHRLDTALARSKLSLAETIREREATGSKADAVDAEMTRHLAEPALVPSFDPATHRARLTNPVVEVDAEGEPEDDLARLGFVALTLRTTTKLAAFRAPNDLPPFIELDAIAALTPARRLRPTSITYLYRLAGPPRKFRRTYRLVPTLTDRDREAIDRIDRLRESTPTLRYEQYRRDK